MNMLRTLSLLLAAFATAPLPAQEPMPRTPQWGGPAGNRAVQVQRQPARAPALTQRAMPPPASGGVLQLLTLADDAPVQWGERTMPAGAAKQQLLQQMAAAGVAGVPERAGVAASGVATAQTIARGNAALRAHFEQLTFEADAPMAQSALQGAQGQAMSDAGGLRLRRQQMQRVVPAETSGTLGYAVDPAGWCQSQGNTPRISRVLADGNRLTPDGEFVVQGRCFGRQRGTVQVTLPSPVGTLTLTPLEWADHKLLVKLPPEISGLAASEARLSVLRGDQVLSTLLPMPFEPVWVETDVPSRLLRLLDCANPGTCTNFVAPPSGLLLPGLFALLQPWGGTAPPRGVAALHISDTAIAGRDVFHVQLPDWARVSGAAEVIRQGYPQLSRVDVQVGGDLGDLTRPPGERPAATVTVNWQMSGLVQRVTVSALGALLMGPLGAVDTSQFGYCHYTLNLKALVPRGLSL